MNRRQFLHSASVLAAAISLPRGIASAASRPPRILLRSSWQVVNIGDIAHTPGVLALLENHIPEAEVILWASADLSPEVVAMEHKRFPKLKIVKGKIESNGQVTHRELEDAIHWCDFLLHSSGPSMVAHADVRAFVKLTGKPFGVYGITYGGFGTAEKELMSQAQFVFFRDTISLAKAKADGVKCPIMEFGPDGAFAADVRDDQTATSFLSQHGLEEGKFLCCIPRLRYTPYWRIHGRPMTREDERKHARNEAMKEHDHAPLRDAISAVVRETGYSILVCPEDKSQMEVGKEMLLDKLPSNIRQRVVWREQFWLTDQALSTYRLSAGLFGNEMHSPIMAVGQGIPAIVCRFAEQTSKGQMWRDIGLGDWLFDLDEEKDSQRIVAAVLEMVKEPAAARNKVAQAMEFVRRRQKETMEVVRRSVVGSQKQ